MFWNEKRVTPDWTATFAVDLLEEGWWNGFNELDKVLADQKSTFDKCRTAADPLIRKRFVLWIVWIGNLCTCAFIPCLPESVAPGRHPTMTSIVDKSLI